MRHRAALRAGLLWAGAIYLCMLYAFPLFDRGLYPSDMNANLAWAHRLRDPALFPGNLAIDYERHYYGGVAFALVYRAGTLVFASLDVMTLGKMLPFALGAGMLALAYRIGRCAGDGSRVAGAAAMLLLMSLRIGVFIDLWSNAQGGMPRAFFYPLLLLGCVGMLERRAWLVALAAFCGALFYAPAYLLLGLAAVLGLAFERAPLRDRVRRALVLAPAGLVGGALLAWHARGDAQFGALLDWAHAAALPLMQRGGIVPDVLAPTRLGSLAATHFGVTWPPVLLALPCALWWVRQRRLPRGLSVCAALAAAGLIGYAAAYAFYFHLYVPTRYAAALPIAAWICAALTLGDLLGARPTHSASASETHSLLARSPAACSLAALAGFTLLVGLNAARMRPGPRDTGHTGLSRTRLSPSMRAAIASLPRDAVVAAHPQIAGEIQFLGKRNAYVEAEGLYPFHARFHAATRARTLLQAGALYATRWEEVTSFSRAAGVGYALIDQAMFAPDYGDWARFYPELRPPPLAPGARFVLAAPPPSRVIASDDGVALIEIAR